MHEPSPNLEERDFDRIFTTTKRLTQCRLIAIHFQDFGEAIVLNDVREFETIFAGEGEPIVDVCPSSYKLEQLAA